MHAGMWRHRHTRHFLCDHIICMPGVCRWSHKITLRIKARLTVPNISFCAHWLLKLEALLTETASALSPSSIVKFLQLPKTYVKLYPSFNALQSLHSASTLFCQRIWPQTSPQTLWSYFYFSFTFKHLHNTLGNEISTTIEKKNSFSNASMLYQYVVYKATQWENKLLFEIENKIPDNSCFFPSYSMSYIFRI